MHDMTREEKNKREVLLAGLDGTQRMLPGFLFTRSEEARHARRCQHQRNHKLANPLFRAGLTGITSITALQERKNCKANLCAFVEGKLAFQYRSRASSDIAQAHLQNVRVHTYTD
jgi:hypothetical protein